MGFFDDLKKAAQRGTEKGKQDIKRREEAERKKIEMLNEISRRRNKVIELEITINGLESKLTEDK